LNRKSGENYFQVVVISRVVLKFFNAKIASVVCQRNFFNNKYLHRFFNWYCLDSGESLLRSVWQMFLRWF